MFSSLRSRLLLTYIIVIGVALGVVAVVTLIYLSRNPAQVAQARIQLQAAAAVIVRRSQDFDPNALLQLENALQRADEAMHVRVMVYTPAGELLADSRASEQPPFLAAISQRGMSAASTVVAIEDENGEAWLYLMQSLDTGYWLGVATPRPQVTFWAAVRSRSDEVINLLRQGGIVALLLSLVLAFGMSRWVAAPLQRISQAARRFASGKYLPIEPRGPHEVQALAQTFNEMAAQVLATQQSQRDFIANISHELKTPLTSIQGFAQAIMDGTAQTAGEHREASQIIYNEAARMHRMVLDLLDLARLDAGTLEFERAPLDVQTLLRGIITKLGPQASQAQVKLHLQADELPTLIGDGDRMAQVFTNLVDNAIQHTPAGGSVQVSSRQHNGNIYISIADTGVGIPHQELERIFERFYQVDKSRPGGGRHGSGLGLTIAHEIVLAHGGSISVESVPGQGSIFVVKLPLARRSDAIFRTQRPYV